MLWPRRSLSTAYQTAMYMLIKIYSPVVTMYVAMSLYNITIVRDGGILNIQLECSYSTCSLGKEVKVHQMNSY